MDKGAASWDKTKESDAVSILGKIKEEVNMIAKSRRDVVTPKPMEFDKVRSAQAGEVEQYDYEGGDFTEEDVEVCYVGRGNKGQGKGRCACFTCGAMGHRAAECPNKGLGKGQNGKGKG